MTDEIGHLLAENTNDHTYTRTPEESLLHMYRTMKIKQEDFRNVEKIAGVTGVQRKCSDILSQDYAWTFVAKTEPMGIHMFDSKTDMKLANLHKVLLGPGGGVSHTINISPRRVTKCSRSSHTWYRTWRNTWTCASTMWRSIDEQSTSLWTWLKRNRWTARKGSTR